MTSLSSPFFSLEDAAERRTAAVRCARQMLADLGAAPDPRSIAAIDAAENYAKDLVTDVDLGKAQRAASSAAIAAMEAANTYSPFSYSEMAAHRGDLVAQKVRSAGAQARKEARLALGAAGIAHVSVHMVALHARYYLGNPP